MVLAWSLSPNVVSSVVYPMTSTCSPAKPTSVVTSPN
jgi:hypothetical protein